METRSKNIELVSPFKVIRRIHDLLHNSALFMAGSKARARMLIAVATEPVEPLLEKKKHQIIYKKLNDHPEIYRCRLLKNEIEETDQATIPEWVMTNYKDTGVFLIVSFANYQVFEKILRFLRGLYPKIARTYFNTGYIYNFLRRIDKKDDRLHIRITKLVAKNRIESEGAQKIIASSIDWTDITYQEAFIKLNEEDAWIKSIDLSLTISDNGSKYEAAGSIARDGVLVCKNNIKFFFYQVVQQALQKAFQDKELFMKRSRRENPGLKVRPLVIEFGKPIFSDKSNNHRLINALRKMPNSSLSVFHANPYLQASMIDYGDGSTYRIWVLSEDSMIIVPQMRATVGSLQRLFNHIGERFMEGKISELNN